MNERRIARLQEVIKARAAEVIAYELADPRGGLITVTKVELDREMATCKISWSALGSEAERRTCSRMLSSARGFVQREIGRVLHTRTVPRVSFAFDESIEGAIRMQNLLDDIKAEREARQSESADSPLPGADPDPDDGETPDAGRREDG